MHGALTVIMHLDVVRRVWPAAKQAIGEATLMQADVALQFHLARNALEALDAAASSVKGTDFEPLFDGKRGLAYAQLGQDDVARQHLVAAQRSPRFHALHRFDAQWILQSLAHLDRSRGAPAEAAHWFRAIADLPGQRSLVRATYLLAALKESVLVSDDNRAAARRDLALLEAAIEDVRSAPDYSKQVRPLNSIEHDLERLRDQHGL